MRLKTILNRIEKHASFVYTQARWVERAGGAAVIEVSVRARANGRAICAGCQRRAPGYDVLGERRFEYVPLWGIAVFLVYTMRRVQCRRCGVRVEQGA
jgi:transposase